ncbi:MAG: TlpA family protein disulfide reductase, partial [Nitrospira sp.]
MAGTPQALAPDFTLPTLEGGAMSLTDLQGKVVMLNFWGTWCAPCAAEMPDLDALQRQYGKAHDFVVLGVNL